MEHYTALATNSRGRALWGVSARRVARPRDNPRYRVSILVCKKKTTRLLLNVNIYCIASRCTLYIIAEWAEEAQC